MIYNCDTIPGKAPANYHRYICDTVADLDKISLKECCPGSTAIILKPAYQEMVLGANYKWCIKVINTGGSSGSGGVITNIEEIPDETMLELLDKYLPIDGSNDDMEEIPDDVMESLLDEYLGMD